MTRTIGSAAALAATAALLAALAAATGCSRIIDEGVEKTLGPTAFVLPLAPKLPPDDQNSLAQYKNFELATVRSEFPDTPAEFMDAFPAKFAEQMRSKDLPIGRSGPALLVNVTILGYQPAVSYHKALGPTEEVIARVELTEKANNAVVARAICIGRTYQSVGLGPRWKAWGLARAIVDQWINKHYPQAGRRAAAEEE